MGREMDGFQKVCPSSIASRVRPLREKIRFSIGKILAASLVEVRSILRDVVHMVAISGFEPLVFARLKRKP